MGLATAAAPSSALVLYDPALGSLPVSQGWLSTGLGPVTHGVNAGVYSLDTTALISTQWGHAQTLSATPLNTEVGFDLNFALRVLSEDHGGNVNRAGFSIIFTGQDPTQSLELAFWADKVWAYHYDSGLASPFVQGPGAVFNTTVMTNYSLQVRQQSFTLLANNSPLFSGVLENYTAQGTPYSGANFVFFGDDTSSARASVQLGAIVLSAVPEPAALMLWLLGGGLLLARHHSLVRRRQSSGNSTTSSRLRR